MSEQGKFLEELEAVKSIAASQDKCADNGCIIVPPMLTFYNGADSLEQQIDHIIGKILMQFGIEYQKFVAWQGEEA